MSSTIRPVGPPHRPVLGQSEAGIRLLSRHLLAAGARPRRADAPAAAAADVRPEPCCDEEPACVALEAAIMAIVVAVAALAAAALIRYGLAPAGWAQNGIEALRALAALAAAVALWSAGSGLVSVVRLVRSTP